MSKVDESTTSTQQRDAEPRFSGLIKHPWFVAYRRQWRRLPVWVRDYAPIGALAGLLVGLIIAPIAGSFLRVLVIGVIVGAFFAGVAAGLNSASQTRSGSRRRK